MGTRDLYRLPVIWAAAALAGCGALAGPPLAPALGPAAKGIGQRDLLYVSNANGTVAVYRYWQHTPVGLLKGFAQPLGECADPAGDVYVSDYRSRVVAEYAHGATKRSRTIHAGAYHPHGCSVDPASGDLAVVNYERASHTAGNVTIYRRGRRPAVYTVSSRDHFTSCAYDDAGDLLVTSRYGATAYATKFYYLARGAKALAPVDLPGPSKSWSWPYVSGLAWDGQYWVVAANNALYRYTIGGSAQYVGGTALSGGYGTIGQVWIYRKGFKSNGTQVVAGDDNFSKSAVDYWSYPGGGDDIHQITKNVDQPFGVAVSYGTQ